MSQKIDNTFAVAPMVDWTDRHCRYFHRLLSRRAVLYTEMLSTGAVLNGDPARVLAFSGEEHPVVAQLGGADPDDMARAAERCAEWGYDAININVGCPSDKVKKGRFGAVLFKEPETVAACAAAMRRAVDLPVTVKCRIGADDTDAPDDLLRFVDTVAAAGVSTFIVHARKAWLKGLSPKQNRTVPPIDYERVYWLKERRPELEIVINGEIRDMASCREHLRHVDGVMLGRAAYETPWLLAEVDVALFGDPPSVTTPEQALARFIPYVEHMLEKGVPLNAMTRHLLGLFRGRPGARAFRRVLSEKAPKHPADIGVLHEALAHITAIAAE